MEEKIFFQVIFPPPLVEKTVVFQPPTCLFPSSCTEKLILIVVISFDVTFPRAISANGWSVSLPKEGKAADDDNYKGCWMFLSICVEGSLSTFSS